jgi:hypothetical protein
VHSFCLELMPDFQPTSEVTHLAPLFDQHIFSPLTMILISPCRTQCLPLEPGQLFIMQYTQFQLWDSNPQLWLSWWPGMPQWTQFSSVLLLIKEKAYLWLHLLLTPKFGKVRSLTCGSNAVRNPSGRRKVSPEEFDKRVRGRQFASVRQENCCADFAGLRGDVAWAEGTNGWISDRI